MAEYSGSAATATEDSEEPQDFDPSEADQDVHVTESTDKKKRLFTKEFPGHPCGAMNKVTLKGVYSSGRVRCMMYGFGDDQNPYAETVDLLEDLVLEFITEMTLKATEVGRQGRVQVEDIIFLIRKDPRKYSRIKQLLLMNEELKKARKAFDEANY